jgi:hypothetical protein
LNFLQIRMAIIAGFIDLLYNHLMRLRIPVVIALLLATVPVWAHHGVAGFDQTKPVHLTGKISMLEWTNPHVVIHFDVTGTDGKTAAWLMDMAPPSAAKRNGLSQSSFPIGMEISVDGYQATDGSNRVTFTSVALGDGRKFAATTDCFAAPEKCYHAVDAKTGFQLSK